MPAAWSKAGSARVTRGGAVAYVSFEGKIILMPGWKHSTVRSIVVTKSDGAVEVITRDSSQPGDRANLLGLLEQVGEGSDASVVPSPPVSRVAPFPRAVAPPYRGPPRPPRWPPPPLSSPSGAVGSASGSAPHFVSAAGGLGGFGRRRKRRALAVEVCPQGLPQSVYDHHWEDTHGRGRDAALSGDFSYVLRAAAEAGCAKCVFAILSANPGSAEELVSSEGAGGWDAAAWAEWGVKQALKAGDTERAGMCRDLQDHLERMRVEGVHAVLGEFESETTDQARSMMPRNSFLSRAWLPLF